ncbi:precorrin-6A/cobalt-precorrin-6A reductase [Selenomonas sp. GACV-9]|uniref:precorrin-6A reductase n=1 Tax=Selenomonas sp. GACV-9 TaxID=3158782 RepID=UPI0008E0F5C9|nr:precorrin-6A/cobalt-precorrin-6A reductase [Selenomonas ruminantium]
MIFVAAGTQDGRELSKYLLEHGYDVAASVVSHYGEQLLADCRGRSLIINDKPLDKEGLESYLTGHRIRLLVDASHPYAVNVSANAMEACQALGIPYVRYERDLTAVHYDQVTVVHSYEEAAAAAARLGKRIFLTTGSRNLAKFTTAEELQDRELVARVLPTAEVISLCESLGLTPGQIVAMQGPFSKQLNKELFQKYQADVIVTKNSGTIGGTDTKFAAAEELDLPVVVIDRPVMAYGNVGRTYEDILRFVEEHY